MHMPKCALNDIVKRALDVAGLSAVLEPFGLNMGNDRRPNGMTVFLLHVVPARFETTRLSMLSAMTMIVSALSPSHTPGQLNEPCLPA